ncbi:MAG: serine/threonine-protein kinase [Polyangiales bacterium]
MGSIAPDGVITCRACGEQSPAGSKFCGACGEGIGGVLPRPGDVIAGRYRVVAPIGRGAMGTVYRAEHVQISKVVAIKILHEELQHHPDNVKRFHFEAESASRLNHPNTVQVFDFGRTEAGSLYIVMEFVDGADLGKVIDEEGPLPFGRVAYLCAQVAGSVADAHDAGILHRDLKPENIVVTHGRDGERAKVLDFGLAKLFEADPQVQVTGAGTIVGTPYYMSPEQVQAHQLDGRSDVYAIGAIMYECVVGKPPFEAPNPVGVLSKHLTQAPLSPSSRSPISVPPEADTIIMRCLEKDRDERYESAEALRVALIEYLASVGEDDWRTRGLGIRDSASGTRPVDSLFERKRSRWWIVALVAALLAGVGAWRTIASAPSEREPNHSVKRANKLKLATPTEGYLGQRLDSETGDVDLFLLSHQGPGTGTASIEVSPIPNMDIVVELLRPELGDPIVIADSRGLGEGEGLPNIPLEPGTYVLRVREHSREEGLPTENVSDAYTVRWEFRDADAGFETERNDSLELAESLPLGAERRGWIGWSGDVDTYCVGESADAVVAQVSGLEEVDLIVRVVDRQSERSRKIDDNGVGRGETSKTWRNVEAGNFCVEVSADVRDVDGLQAQSDQTYGVRFIRGAER